MEINWEDCVNLEFKGKSRDFRGKKKELKKFKCVKFHKTIHLLPNLAFAKTSNSMA